MNFVLSAKYDPKRIFSLEYNCANTPEIIGKCLRYSATHVSVSFRINPKMIFVIIISKDKPCNNIYFSKDIFTEFKDVLTLVDFSNIDFGSLLITTDNKTTNFTIRKDTIQFIAHEYDGYYKESYSTNIYNIRTYTNEIIGDFLTPGFWFY